MSDLHEKRVEALEAERDAAVAAIERVRVTHVPFTWSFGYGPVQSCKWCADHGVSQEDASWPCATIQALDGAPEPEWEWAVRESGDDEPFSDVYQTREHLAEHETGIAWGEEQLVRRRPAGPWLPVEGESK